MLAEATFPDVDGTLTSFTLSADQSKLTDSITVKTLPPHSVLEDIETELRTCWHFNWYTASSIEMTVPCWHFTCFSSSSSKMTVPFRHFNCFTASSIKMTVPCWHFTYFSSSFRHQNDCAILALQLVHCGVRGNDCAILSFLIVLVVHRNDCVMGLFQLVYRVVYRNYCAMFAVLNCFTSSYFDHRKGSVPKCNLDYLHGGRGHYYVVY